jgi:hypothetical protein
MAENDIIAYIFLKHEVTRDTWRSLIQCIDDYPNIELSSINISETSIENIADPISRVVFDWTFSTQRWHNKTPISLNDEEIGQSSLFIGGTRQVMFWIGDGDLVFRNYPKQVDVHFDLLKRMVETIRPFFIFCAHETAFMFPSEWARTPKQDAINPLIMGLKDRFDLWYYFYIDQGICDNINMDKVKEFLTLDLEYLDGRLISFYPTPLVIPRDHPWVDRKPPRRAFVKHVLPHIKERFYKEYSTLLEK